MMLLYSKEPVVAAGVTASGYGAIPMKRWKRSEYEILLGIFLKASGSDASNAMADHYGYLLPHEAASQLPVRQSG